MEIPDSARARVNTYIRKQFALVPPVVLEFEQRAAALPIPPHHITPEVGRFLEVLVRAIGARRVLEIGTMWGYSAWWLAQGLASGGTVTTLDKDLKHFNVATEFFAAAGLNDRVVSKHVNALDELQLPEYERGSFDFIFLDADKREYPAMYGLCVPLLRSGGLFVVDNVIYSSAWNGLTVADETEDQRIRHAAEFNRLVAESDELVGVPLAIRSGVMVAVKK